MTALVARLWRLALLLAGLLAASAALRSAPGEAMGWAAVNPAAPGSWLGFAAAAAALCACGVPRQAVAFAGGYAFGAWGGGALALAAQLAGCALSFGWARAVGRTWIRARFPVPLERADRLLQGNLFNATVILRLLPVGNNLMLNLLAGVLSVPAVPFLAGSLVGYVPQTLVFALLGSGGRPARGTEIGVGAGLFVASAALGAVWLRRGRGPTNRAVSATASHALHGAPRLG